MNQIVYFIGTAMDFRDMVYARWSHLNHHAYTIITEADLKISAPRPVKLWNVEKFLTRFFTLTEVRPAATI